MPEFFLANYSIPNICIGDEMLKKKKLNSGHALRTSIKPDRKKSPYLVRTQTKTQKLQAKYDIPPDCNPELW
jgi:hypothetical protein